MCHVPCGRWVVCLCILSRCLRMYTCVCVRFLVCQGSCVGGLSESPVAAPGFILGDVPYNATGIKSSFFFLLARSLANIRVRGTGTNWFLPHRAYSGVLNPPFPPTLHLHSPHRLSTSLRVMVCCLQTHDFGFNVPAESTWLE